MGPVGFFPTNPNLADMLGDTDFDFEKFYLFGIVGVPNFPDFQIPGPDLIHFVAIFLLPPVIVLLFLFKKI